VSILIPNSLPGYYSFFKVLAITSCVTDKESIIIPGKEKALSTPHTPEPYCYIVTNATSYQVCDSAVLYGEVTYILLKDKTNSCLVHDN